MPLMVARLYPVAVGSRRCQLAFALCFECVDKCNSSVPLHILCSVAFFILLFVLCLCSLVVSAVDNGPLPHSTAYTEVNINLLDVNEYKPAFPRLFYWEYVSINQPVGTFVVTVKAPDRDAGQYGVVRYYLALIPESANGTFVIDPETGCVYTGVVFTNVSTYSFKIVAVDAGGLNATAGLLITVQVPYPKPLTFTKTSYQFVVRADAKIGDEVGRVQLAGSGSSADAVEYYLRPKNDHFDINATSGVIFVKKDLQDWSTSASRRRRRAVEAVSLTVVARYGGRESTVVVQISVNVTGCCVSLSPNPTQSSTSSLGTGTSGSGGLSGTPLVILIVLVSVAVIIVGVVAIVCLRRRRRRHVKSPPSVGGGDNGPSTIESSSLETFDVPPPAFGGFRPPPYHESKLTTVDIGCYAARNVNGTTSEMTGEDDGAESSGRGSAEKNAGDDLDDDEIRIINAVMSEIGGGGSAAYVQLRRARIPDSGIQPDRDYESGSEASARDRAYLARLGIDVGGAAPGRSGQKKIGGLQGRRGPPSVESIHQFSEEGGGEAAMLDDSSTADRRSSSDGEGTSSSLTRRERSAPVVDAEEVFSGPFNWDYLLDWKPEYRPLADVFAEIARLPDENASRHRAGAIKTCPTQIVPQQRRSNRRGGGASAAGQHHRDGPPPIITNVPPMAVNFGSGYGASCEPAAAATAAVTSSARGGGSISSACSSTSSSRRHAFSSVPASAVLTYESELQFGADVTVTDAEHVAACHLQPVGVAAGPVAHP
jgi:protocadherin-16/23